MLKFYIYLYSTSITKNDLVRITFNILKLNILSARNMNAQTGAVNSISDCRRNSKLIVFYKT